MSSPNSDKPEEKKEVSKEASKEVSDEKQGKKQEEKQAETKPVVNSEEKKPDNKTGSAGPASFAGADGSAVKSKASPQANFKRQKRLSQYGLQLKEKQLARRTYGVSEKQFLGYYHKAIAKTGDTGELLNKLLEQRLDNLVYRTGLASTRRQARQYVTHGLFTVNGRRVDIPSYQVRAKDIIAVGENKKSKKVFTDIDIKDLKKREIPSWISFDIDSLTAKITGTPTKADFEQGYDPRLIVEFYSR